MSKLDVRWGIGWSASAKMDAEWRRATVPSSSSTSRHLTSRATVLLQGLPKEHLCHCDQWTYKRMHHIKRLSQKWPKADVVTTLRCYADIMSRSVGELMIAARRQLEERENKLADHMQSSWCFSGSERWPAYLLRVIMSRMRIRQRH